MANDATFDAVFNILEAAAKSDALLSGPICGIIEASKELIRVEYEKVRQETKAEFMAEKDGRLDRHKCAAVLMIAILKGLKTEDMEKNPLVSKVVRERISLAAALTVLVNMIKMDDANPQNKRIIDYWRKNNNTVRYPEPLNGTGKYINNWTVELYYARQKGRLFVLALSHELFLFELYNRMLADMER